MSPKVWGYCKVQKKVVPVEEIVREAKKTVAFSESELEWLNRKVERGMWKWDKKEKKLVSISNPANITHAEAAHGFIQDEMPATKHPIDGKYYTSKSKFRTVTREAGAVEIGDSYEKSVEDPNFYERDASVSKEYKEKIHQTFKEILNNGYNREHSSRR